MHYRTIFVSDRRTYRNGVIRAMIIFFTSTAFTDWVESSFDVDDNATFNPYLAFLFYAL